MKKLIAAVLIVLGILSIGRNEAAATEYSATVSIAKVVAVGPMRPGVTALPFTRILFNDVATFGTCLAGAADVAHTSQNDHLASLLMLAVSHVKDITIFVDSTLTPVSEEGVCIVTAISLNP
jgi:hypothetical protein